MDKDPVVFIHTQNTSLAICMVRLLNQHGISGFWVTSEEAEKTAEGVERGRRGPGSTVVAELTARGILDLQTPVSKGRSVDRNANPVQ
jgi:hypothetical protein